jgi:hypothetical protein
MGWLSLVLQVLTSLPGIIAGVEKAHPTTPGAGKKTLVLDQVNAAMTAAEPVYGPLLVNHPAVQAAISVATDSLVDAFNQASTVAGEEAAAKPTTTPPPTVTPAPAAT